MPISTVSAGILLDLGDKPAGADNIGVWVFWLRLLGAGAALRPDDVYMAGLPVWRHIGGHIGKC